MSIVNVWVEPHRALVAADSVSVGLDGVRLRCSKILPFPHANCVLAGRGRCVLPNLMYGAINTACSSFDDVRERMPSIIAVATQCAVKMLASHGLKWKDADDGRQELYIVGYSAEKTAMKAYAYLVDPDCRVEEIEVTYTSFGPNPGEGFAGGFPKNKEDMLSPAREQMRVLAAVGNPLVVGGGDLIVADLVKDAMRFFVAGDLGERT